MSTPSFLSIVWTASCASFFCLLETVVVCFVVLTGRAVAGDASLHGGLAYGLSLAGWSGFTGVLYFLGVAVVSLAAAVGHAGKGPVR